LAKPSSAHLPTRARDELETLHATLDSRLAALEAALADPNECALEGLILDLARAATEEAEAVARRASAHARADADAQAGSALSQAQVAEAALSTERQAGLELHRSLGAARTELENGKQQLAAVTRELDQMRGEFNRERTQLRAELSEAERCFAAADTLRQQAEVARTEDVAREHATVQRLTDALTQARSEIEGAKQEVASRAADMEAARERADAAARTHADLTKSVNEARARADAVSQERDRLKTELDAARQNVATAALANQSAATERTAIEQKWHDAEARAAAATRERDALLAERNTAAVKLETARQGSTTAAAAAQAIETQRAALEKSLRDAEARAQTLARERDTLLGERDTLQAKREAVVAERDAAMARRDAVEAERASLHAQLDAARQSSTAKTAVKSLDAHRATAEHSLDAEELAQTMRHELDAAIAQRDAAIAERAAAIAQADAIKKMADAPPAERAAALSELQQRTEREMQILETQLLGTGDDGLIENGPEISVVFDDADETPVAEVEPVVMAATPKAGASRPAQAGPPAANQPVRAASRHAFREPLEVKLDGETALLVDLSTGGAQLLSGTALKPNKQVKLLLPSSEAIILCKGKIVWARFEPPSPGKPVRYRAGMVFSQADVGALQIFINRHAVGRKALGSEERKTGRLMPFNAPSAGSKSRRADPVSSIDFKFPASKRGE
jgi:chromosome segregation ATPase